MILVLQQVLWIILLSVCMITLPALVVGIFISVIQAATQINEMTITFISKLIVMFLVLISLIPWLFTKLVYFTQQLMLNIPNYLH